MGRRVDTFRSEPFAGVGWLVGMLLAWALSACVALGDSVALRSVARVEAGQPILLRDVATLDGAHAVSLGDVVVAASPGGAGRLLELGLDDVRSKLAEARPEARLGAIAFSGLVCSVRVTGAAAEEPVPVVPARVAPERASAREAMVQRVADLPEDSLARAIGGRLASFVGASIEDVRVGFEARDETILSTPTGGRTLDLQPTGLGSSVPVLVRVLETDRVVAAGTVRVRVEVKRRVVVATRTLRRGQQVGPEAYAIEDRWVSPGETFASSDEVNGMVVRGRFEGGRPVLASDLELPLIVRRGEIVTVACVSGSVVMQMKARALAPARAGEVIELASLGERKARVRARIVGPGQGLMTTDAGDERVFQPTDGRAPARVEEAGSEASAPALGSAAEEAGSEARSASVGRVRVERVRTNADGSFVLETRREAESKPARRMKFVPLEDR